MYLQLETLLMGSALEQRSQLRCCPARPEPVHGGDSVMQKQDFGQLNIMPRHTFLRKGYDSTHRRVITSQQVKMASEFMLQGVVKEVSVWPLSVNELAAGVEEVWVT